MKPATEGLLSCAAGNVRLLDDGASDASAVALAVADMCRGEYVRMVNANAVANLDNEDQYRIFYRRQMAAERRISTVLPLVLGHRNGTLLR